jgi:RHS repeat-associated protein
LIPIQRHRVKKAVTGATSSTQYLYEGGKVVLEMNASGGERQLYYLNARYYNPKIARFISQDTYTGNTRDPLSLNLYTYGYNNPIRYYDPTGHIVT